MKPVSRVEGTVLRVEISKKLKVECGNLAALRVSSSAATRV